MAQQTINVGTTANDGTGDSLRNGFIKVNQNFTELYTNRISGSGTDNYIPRFNGTNALENSIIFDNGTNVGIGTSSPASLLQIEGASPFITINKSSGLNLGTTFKSSGTIVGEFNLNTSNGEFKTSSGFSGYGGFLTYYTDSSEKMRITSSGNVGIGTTTFNFPGSNRTNLAINGSVSSIIEWQAGSATLGYAIASSSSFDLGSATAIPLTFNTIATERMRIDSSGNVGIGTSYPTGKLDLVDYDRGVDGYGNFNIFTNDSASTSKGGSIAFGGNNSTGGTTPYPFAKIQGIKSSEAGSYRGALRFATASSSSELIERMRIDHNGNVGIGTSSPFSNAKVQIRPSSDVNIAFQPSNGLSSGGKINAFDDAASVNVNLELNGLNLGFKTNETERMRITSSGNVGIGTSSPSGKLNVLGSGTTAISISNSNAGTSGSPELTQLNFLGFLQENRARIEATDVANSANGSELRFYNANTSNSLTERMRITSSGNVGIGTTSPAYKFEVSDGTRTAVINPNSSLDGVYIGVTEAKPLIFGTSDNERMRITSSGNVGIGATNTYGWKTFINSGSSSSTLLLGSSTSGVYISLNDNNSTAPPRIGGITNDLVFTTSNAERMRITSSGVINMSSLPTSSAGLSSGDIWNDGGTLKIV